MESEPQSSPEDNLLTIDNQITVFDVWRSYSLPLPRWSRIATWLVIFVGFVAIVDLAPEYEAFWRPLYFVVSIILAIGGDFMVARSFHKQRAMTNSALLQFGAKGIDATMLDRSKLHVDWRSVYDIRKEADGIAIKMHIRQNWPLYIPNRNITDGTTPAELFAALTAMRKKACAQPNLEAEEKSAGTTAADSGEIDKSAREEKEAAKAPPQDAIVVPVDFKLQEYIASRYTIAGFNPYLGLLFIVGGLAWQAWFAVTVGILTIITPAYTARKNFNQIKDQSFALWIDDVGVHTSTDEKTWNVIAWPHFTSVKLKYNQLTCKYGDQDYVFVPMRCLPSKETASQFVERATTLWQKYGQKRHDFGDAPVTQTEQKRTISDAKTAGVAVQNNLMDLILARYYVSRYLMGSYLIFAIASCFLPIIIGPAIFIFMLLRPLWTAYSRHKSLQGHGGTVTLSEEGFDYFDNVQQSNTLVHWSTFIRISEWNDLLIFEINDENHLVIPNRCFASQEEALKFVDQARAYWSANSGQKAIS